HPAPARSGPPSHRRWLVLGGAVLVLLAGLVMAWSVLSPVVAGMFESNDYDGPGHGEVAVEVEQGDTGRVIATTLVDKGVIKTVQAFEEALASTPGDEIQPGHYTLQQEMPASAALSALRSGESRTEMTVTIREGLRAVEIFPLLAEATDTPLEDYQALAENPDVLDLPDAAQGEIEGFLYPATYTFGPNDDAAAQLRAMVAQGKARYTEFNVPEDELRDVITIASIIEAEARLPEDMGKVASVIENRLRIGMGLQMDSTVAYGVGERTLTTSDEQRRDDNPYNTYLHAGLPRGPINNPGEATIRATLDPADEEYLYFVTVNPQTGETLFSQTLAEHNQNVRQFQAWCQANPGQC
ncbi:MAG: endolytic transglycosylase MltG, partial [Mobilicoccus sp.]|nr:endolytic transglycosylase MltG [Mobilicoccus sp.]